MGVRAFVCVCAHNTRNVWLLYGCIRVKRAQHIKADPQPNDHGKNPENIRLSH